jgi:hypothetical protein
MQIVTQAASASYYPVFPLLAAPKIAGLLPARVTSDPVVILHPAFSPYHPPFPTPEELDLDVYTTLHRVFTRLMEASVPLSPRPTRQIGAGL